MIDTIRLQNLFAKQEPIDLTTLRPDQLLIELDLGSLASEKQAEQIEAIFENHVPEEGVQFTEGWDQVDEPSRDILESNGFFRLAEQIQMIPGTEEGAADIFRLLTKQPVKVTVGQAIALLPELDWWPTEDAAKDFTLADLLRLAALDLADLILGSFNAEYTDPDPNGWLIRSEVFPGLADWTNVPYDVESIEALNEQA